MGCCSIHSLHHFDRYPPSHPILIPFELHTYIPIHPKNIYNPHQNPGMTFGQLSKYTSAMYAEMPPNEKEAWNAHAEADKALYLHELSNYVPPPGYDVKGDAIMAGGGSFASAYDALRRWWWWEGEEGWDGEL